jgi:hypothetical protein
LQKSTIPGATAVAPEATCAVSVTAVPAFAVEAERVSVVAVALPLATAGRQPVGETRTK